YEAGQRLFGENKALEMRDKHEILPKDIRWHFIGHLQTNKVKYIAPFVELIHSVDSLNLLKQINKEAIKNNRVIDCLLQIDIAHEETKFGLEENEAEELLSSEEFAELKNVRICGLMGIGSITDDKNKTKKEFNNLKKYFDETKNKFFNSKSYFCELSMGMSQDFELAIEEGATLVRIGSSIFGARDYASKN
ncbi:MAG: YggS family pyridoxal phosphate-dependent enzyme, partial [Bacteroidales bacterium]|nr:YggS family pyridoxal phosphate-dependent enzyme [Bacteroidales bacterium]